MLRSDAFLFILYFCTSQKGWFYFRDSQICNFFYVMEKSRAKTKRNDISLTMHSTNILVKHVVGQEGHQTLFPMSKLSGLPSTVCTSFSMWTETLFDLRAFPCFLCRALDLQPEYGAQENPPCRRDRQDSPALPRTLKSRLQETATVPASLPIAWLPRSEVI